MKSKKPKAKGINLPMDQISKLIVSSFQAVYTDDDKNSYKRAAQELFSLYEKERNHKVNREEYLEEIGYRVRMYVDNTYLKDLDGQLRILKALGLLVGRTVAELNDLKVLDCLIVAIFEKRRDANPDIRASTVTLIGRILTSSMREDADSDDPYPTCLKKKIFMDLYNILVDLSIDIHPSVRSAVVLALRYICRFFTLMDTFSIEPVYRADQLILMATKDEDETVRRYAISNLAFQQQGDARFMFDCLLHEPSEDVRKAAAKRICTELSLNDFSKHDLQTVFCSKSLFLNDYVVSEYYDILVHWSSDAFKLKRGLSLESTLTESQICEGAMDFLDHISFAKEWQLVYSRFLQYLHEKFFKDFADENTFIKFAKLFCEGDTDFIHATNYLEHRGLSTDDSYCSLCLRLRQYFMWLALSEYCLHPSVSETTRIECRLIILPAMVDTIEFIRKAIDIVKREGISAIEDRRSLRIINEIQRFSLKCLLKLIPFLDRDDLGMLSWKSLLNQLLTENLIGCGLDAELYYLIIYQFVYYHFNTKNPEEMDRAVHEIGDICYGIAGTGQHYGTQDLDLSQATDATQYGYSMISESQFNPNLTIRPREDPAIEMTDEQILQCVSILAAVVKTGFFLKPNPVLSGLILNFSVRAFDSARNSEIRSLAFICIAAMASITDQNERNFIRYARAVLDNENESDDLKKTALMMLNDAIQIYSYQKVKEWYFQDMHGENGVRKYEFLKKLIELAEKKGSSSLNRFTIRIMLRLIIFDYTKIFKELLIYLLLRMFRKDDEMTSVLYQYFLNYASCSREHQCILAQASIDALIKLSNCELDSPEAKIDKNLFGEFIVNVTSYSVLKTQAIERELGTAHTILARHLIVKLDMAQEDGFDELLAWMIGHCEVTEVCDKDLVTNLKKACKKVVSQTDSGKVKRHLDAFHKRLESFEKHLTSKKSKIEMPEPMTAAEIEKELQLMMTKLKLMTEETNSEKRSWLTMDINAETDENVTKMKIWGEKSFDKHRFLSQIISKEVVSPPTAPKSVRRTTRTPSTSTTPRKVTDAQTTPVITTRARRNERKRLAPVPEDVMDFIE